MTEGEKMRERIDKGGRIRYNKIYKNGKRLFGDKRK